MSAWRKFLDLFDTPQHTFSEETPRPIDQVIYELNRAAGTTISKAEAFSVPAFLRGRNLICSISTLPLVQYGPTNDVVRHPLLEQIDPNVSNVVVLSQTVEDLLLEGISWWRITNFDSAGFPSSARHLDPGTVSVEPPKGAAPLPSGFAPGGAVWVDGKPVSILEIIRFDSPNPGILKHAGRAIRRALLLDQAAAMYAESPRPLDFFTPAEGADPVEDEYVTETLLPGWNAARKERSTAYIPAALKYNEVQSPTPADLQLAELQKRATLDIANALGLDPEDLGVSTTSRTYQNATDRRQDRINDVLSPYMRAITSRLSMGDITRRGHKVQFDLDDYMKPDPITRWSVYEKAKEMEAITVEEIRAEERMPKLSAPIPAAPAIEASRTRQIDMAGDSLEFVDLPTETFAVDVERRTITGLAVPYGEAAKNRNLKWRFAPGSLRWSDAKRVKLLRDHNYAQAIGHAVELTDTDAGLVVKFKVARGEEGDRALALAEDGVLDGLSIGVDFEAEDTTPDPTNRGVTLVIRANLREVSLTAMPAFDNSRVTSVAASLDGGNTMPDSAEPVTAPAAPPASADMAAFGAAFARMMAGLPAPDPAPEPRAVVDPTASGVTLVSEPEPYRFDSRGNLLRGTHDFSSDLVAGSKGDAAARARAETFMSAQFDVDRTDVSTLNPNRQRPDLYVDQRTYRYPVWEAISKGTLADSTPFVFPKFNSASGLSGAHTEGVEPTAGTFTATGQTVTPTAVSGKVEITREAWDQGGNPQMSNLIWRQMQRSWYEALEASAVAVLDAATPTAIALTAGGGTTGQTLGSELTAAFAGLQFIRGGFSMDTGFAQVDLYKALIGALDDSGRPLFPALGPSNANGTSRTRFGAVDVNGSLFYPAWGLAATGSVVASSYLFDSEVVHGWATAPQRLDFEYRVAYVDLAIWGYKATAISDISGVREITYDPAA